MSDQSLANMLIEIQDVSTEYALRATELSKFLEWFETKLDSLPGKSQIRTDNAQSGYSLLFSRGHGDKWTLYISEDAETVPWSEVRESSIFMKAEAAKLAVPLVQKLISQQKELLAAVTDGLDAAQPYIDEWKGGQ